MGYAEALLQKSEPEPLLQKSEPEVVPTDPAVAKRLLLWAWCVMLIEYCFVALTVMTTGMKHAKAFAYVVQVVFFCASLFIQGRGYQALRRLSEASGSPASRKFYEEMEAPATHVFDVVPVPGWMAQKFRLKHWQALLVTFGFNFIAALSSAAYLDVVRERWLEEPQAQRLFKERWAFVPFVGQSIGNVDNIVILYACLLAWCCCVHIYSLALKTIQYFCRDASDESYFGHAMDCANLLFLGKLVLGRVQAVEHARGF